MEEPRHPRRTLSDAVPPSYQTPVFIMIFAGVLLMVSLYQLEVVYIGITSGWPRFDFPFYIYSCTFPVARDIFYAVNVASFALFAYGAATFQGRRVGRHVMKALREGTDLDLS